MGQNVSFAHACLDQHSVISLVFFLKWKPENFFENPWSTICQNGFYVFQGISKTFKKQHVHVCIIFEQQHILGLQIKPMIRYLNDTANAGQ